MIELKDITVSRGNRILFENFNLKISKGEHWIIQGDNGAGKTTLLQLIAGALHPSSGKVIYSFIKGSDWDTLFRQRQEKIQFIPTHAMGEFLNGYSGLFYQQRYYSMGDTQLPKVKDVFGEWVGKLVSQHFSESFNIGALLDIELTRLSNGQLKKVLILSHLVKHIPAVLLLDYPFDGLDQESRQDLSNFISHIAGKFNIQVILVDHDDSFPSVINRRLVLHHFRIQQIETVKRGHTALPSIPSSSRKNRLTTDDTPAVVEMKGLTIQYNGKTIIDKLNWKIKKGERWALTGKNGSGKTTLFSLIFADHPMAYSQKVFLFGKRRGSGESIWDIKKRINYLGPEQIHFLDPQHITITGRDYIFSQDKNDSRGLDKLVDFFNAGDFIDKPVRLLSSGQLQIMLLLNFFLHPKELLLLDEPFQFLDPHNHEQATRYLNQYLDEQVTLILITHNERDVRAWTQLRKIL